MQPWYTLIWLHSILCTYRDTFRDSTDVPTTYWSRCNLRYKPHFALFSCDFLTTGFTHWSRAQIYQSNDYVSQKLDSTHSPASTTCIWELHTFCDFVPFCDFCAFLQFWSFHTSEAHPRYSEHWINHLINWYQHHHVFLLRNTIVSIKSAEVRRTSTQAHQIWKPSDPTLYSIHPHASVISLKNSETRSNLSYLLIKLIVFADGTYDHGVCAFILPPFIHIFVV